VSDTFVDLTYRGLALGRRVKLTQVRPTTAYLELPAPMPVGTLIGILTDDTVALDAQVVAIHEQVGGSEQVPGMVVKPRLEGDAAQAWWNARVTLPQAARPPTEPPPVPAQPATIVLPKRRTLEGTTPPGVPELVDDGLKTTVMQAIDPDEAGISTEPTGPSNDDGRSTTAMSAVDLAALGLEPNTQTTNGQLPVIAVDDEEDSGATGDKPDGKTKKKRRRR
jgi:hypothetical protein